ncbi:hypothetical protein [Sulfuritalea hydrogenivorans]|uniref:hypothetical protein n=1 Tax=Sulfuritalea hydrogenivorans TaxID=748811 RepID=UPI000597E382|nr:hypothetical protein [Sulfuritalea hydrogenivorans]
MQMIGQTGQQRADVFLADGTEHVSGVLLIFQCAQLVGDLPALTLKLRDFFEERARRLRLGGEAG